MTTNTKTEKTKNSKNKKNFYRKKPHNKNIDRLAKNLYEANLPDSYHSPKFDGFDINDSVSMEALPLLYQVREREANSPVISSALNRLVTLIVGESGTMIKPSPLIDGNEVDHDLAEKLLIKWREFCISPLVNKKGLNFRSVQALIVRGWMRDGDSFVQLITKKSDTQRNKLEFKLRIIEGDKLPYNNYKNLNIGGFVPPIEVNEYGRPIAYNFTLNPTYPSEVTRILDEDILHIANIREPNQLRGVSKFAPLLKSVSKIDKFLDTNLNAAQLRNLFIGDITDNNDLGGNLSAVRRKETLLKNHKLGNNLMVVEVAKGKNLNMHSPAKTDVNLSEFIEVNLRLAAASLGIDFEGLFLRYDGTYSSLKMSQINLQKQTKAYIDEFDNCIVRPIYRRFVDFLLLNDPDFRDVNPDKYNSIYNAIYNHNEFSSIDPLKEAEADLILVRSGLESIQSLASKTGRSAEEIAQQNSNLKDLYENLGLIDNWNYIFPNTNNSINKDSSTEDSGTSKKDNATENIDDNSSVPSQNGEKQETALKVSNKKRSKAYKKQNRVK